MIGFFNILQHLPPDTLHHVCVQAERQLTSAGGSHQPRASGAPKPPHSLSGGSMSVDTNRLAAFIEFRTLPIGELIIHFHIFSLLPRGNSVNVSIHY
ncbi:unnamed protein product [Protopolystoma xenopodis]|uniref:Uncharacterized protein n=1 Tax=Protopolystoma xenopodis TaxID=117903 RepID=A0A448WVL6_9PLAT|nr:unnamed protein product [Protopolystoma xenopodis]